MKRYRLTESNLRGMIREAVKNALREVEEQQSTNLTRFGRDPEEFGGDDNLHPEDVSELVQPVVDKLIETYKVMSELWTVNNNLYQKIDDALNKMNLNQVDDDFLRDVENVANFSKENITELESIIGSSFGSYLDDEYSNDTMPDISRRDDRFQNAGATYHSFD